MSGGFIPPSPPHTQSPEPSNHASGSQQPLLSLTLVQERRLRKYIDERLLEFERDEKKHAFKSLNLLLSRLKPLLRIILQIPPLDPWGGLRITYLLTFTGVIIRYITSLPLINLAQQPPVSAQTPQTEAGADGSEENAGEELEDEEEQVEAERTLRSLLSFLHQVDKGWLAVLNGQAWIPPGKGHHSGHAVSVDFGAEVSTTERTRLRSIIISSRAKMIAWARMYGDFSSLNVAQDGTATNGNAAITQDTVEEDPEPGFEWEIEVIRIWNGTLEKLADLDFAFVGQYQ